MTNNGNGKQVALDEHSRRISVLEAKVDQTQLDLAVLAANSDSMRELLEKIDKKLDKREDYCRETTEKIEKRLDAEEKESNLSTWLRKHATSVIVGLLLAGVGALITWLAAYLPE